MTNEETRKTEERGLITSNESIFQSKNKEMFCTMDLEEKENMVKLYNSLQECDVKINDLKGSEIEVVDLLKEMKKLMKSFMMKTVK